MNKKKIAAHIYAKHTRENVLPGEACMCARRSRWCTALSTGLHERSHSARDSPDGESFAVNP